AASRSTKWIHSAPARCQASAASNGSPYDVSVPASPCTKRTAWPAATSTAGSSVKLTRPAYGARSARPHADPAHTPAGSGAFGPHHEVHRDRDHQHAQYEHTPDRDARLCQLRDTKPGD